MRHCQIYDFRQLGRITLNQWRLMKKSIALQSLDKERDLYWQAWLNTVVKNTKKQGKKEVPVFKMFDQFFDYEKLEKGVLGEKEKPKDSGMKALLLKANRAKK